MKKFSRLFLICAVAAAFWSFAGCEGGGGGAEGPVSINSLDGQTNIPVNSVFGYSFARMISTQTVGATSFFILRTPVAAAQLAKADIDPAICDSANALSASVSCPTMIQCTLDPTDDLENETQYTICLTTDIDYNMGVPFAGFMATFTTESGGVTPTATFKLIGLDGTKLDLTAKPIPLRVAVEATFSVPMDPATVEAAMTVTDDADNAVPGVFSWNADNTVATYTLSKNLRYRTNYHVKIAATAASKGTMTAVDQTFVTMTEGDVNGDGRSDILVSATNLSQAPVFNIGAVYVFSGAALGGTTTIGDALAAIYGMDADQLGGSVASAGDVNGDGYDDIIISTTNGDHGAEVNTGTAYIFSGRDLGAASTLATAMSTIYGAAADDRFGDAVSGIGDFDNDGYADVAASAISANNSNRGDTFIFSGKVLQPTMLSSDAFAKLSGAADNDGFGSSISGIGDVTGDGFGDFIIGAPGVAIGGNLSAGEAYVFSGQTISPSSTIGDAISTIVNATPVADALLGDSSSGTGDVNGDGVPDFIVGADSDNADPGFAYVFSGKDLLPAMTTANALASITGAAGGDGFGRPVVGVGDVNGDGFNDIGVGSCCNSGNRGAAYIFSGATLLGAMGTGSALATIVGASAMDFSGEVAGVGDFDGDEKADIAIGANGYNAGTFHGIMYVFTGGSLGASTTLANALVGIVGEAAGSTMGDAIGNTYR